MYKCQVKILSIKRNPGGANYSMHPITCVLMSHVKLPQRYGYTCTGGMSNVKKRKLQ